MRIILSAGVCSIALSGCIPAAAGLALSAASLVTGGNSGQGGKGFQNPIDRQSTGQQVRQALSRLNDQVDPNCQAALDEYFKTHGTLTPGVPVKTPPKDSATTVAANAGEAGTPAPKKPTPVNLLAKLDPQPDGLTGGDVAVSADAVADAKASDAKAPGADTADAKPAGETEMQPVKASLGGHGAPAPGHCEHRLVCLPGTPKPTLMLMCPGKGDPKVEAKAQTPDNTDGGAQNAAASAGDAPQTTAATTAAKTPEIAPDAVREAGSGAAAETAGTPAPQPEQATAALAPAAGEPAATPSPPKDSAWDIPIPGTPAETAPPAPEAPNTPSAPATAAESIPTDVTPAKAGTIDLTAATTQPAATTVSAPAQPVRQTIEGGGVADWNWSFDPSKQR